MRHEAAEIDAVCAALHRIRATQWQRQHALLLLAVEGASAALAYCASMEVAQQIGDLFDVASVVIRDAELTF
jgi:hypothetical protein